MDKRSIFAVAALAASLAMTTPVRAQDSSQQPAGGNPPPPPAPAAKDKAQDKQSDKQNQKPTPGNTAPPAASQATTPEAPPAPAKKPSTGDDNPFPQAVSEKAAAAAKSATPDAPSSPSPSTREGQGSSSLDGMDKLGLDDPARKQLKLKSPDGSTDVYDPKRATEDVRVGRFYLQTGYYKGAYDRFKDAMAFDHENAEAVFWMAEAARKLNLDAEAAQNYQLYLAAVPDGPTAKAARKALGELPAASKP